MSAVSWDMSDVVDVLAQLKGVQVDLRKNVNRELRSAAGLCAAGLVRRLQSAGASASTPQAALVAQSVKVKNDRLPAVQIGGARRVGRRRTAAGVLAWGSEHGGRNFPPGAGGPYWIDPTVKAFEATAAPNVYRLAVGRILLEHGVV